MFLKFTIFFFFENQWVKTKMQPNRSQILGKFQVTIRNFPITELKEIYFQVFYPHTSLLLWQIVLDFIILIFFFDCFIILYLHFRIFGWSARKSYEKFLWVGALQVRFKIRFLKFGLVCVLWGILYHKFSSCSSIFLEIEHLTRRNQDCLYSFDYYH